MQIIIENKSVCCLQAWDRTRWARACSGQWASESCACRAWSTKDRVTWKSLCRVKHQCRSVRWSQHNAKAKEKQSPGCHGRRVIEVFAGQCI